MPVPNAVAAWWWYAPVTPNMWTATVSGRDGSKASPAATRIASTVATPNVT